VQFIYRIEEGIMQEESKLLDSLISIAFEFFRFQDVFEKMLGKLDYDEQLKYRNQYSWFSKKVDRALESAQIKVLNLQGKLYDPGMAVSPLNIDDFNKGDQLYIVQMIEPTILQNDAVYRIGTVVLGKESR